MVRLQKIGFPFTSRKEIILGVNDLATLFPDLAKEWDEEKGYLMDSCLTAQDHFKVLLEKFHIKYDHN